MEIEATGHHRPPGPGLPESLLWTFSVLACKTRVQHHLPDGSVWDPGYPTAEQPPRQLATVARCRQTSGGLTLLTILSVAAFAAAFAWSVAGR